MRLTERLWAKGIAFVLVIVLLAVTAACAAGAACMVEMQMYTTPESAFREEIFTDLIKQDMQITANRLIWGEGEENAYLANRNIAAVKMVYPGTPERVWEYAGTASAAEKEYRVVLYVNRVKESGEYRVDRYEVDRYDTWAPWLEPVGTVAATVRLAEGFPLEDEYFLANRVISLAYSLRYAVYVIGVLALVGAVACFVFLMVASGHRKGTPEPQPGWGTKLPLDLLVLVCGAVVCLSGAIAMDRWYGSDVLTVVLAVVFILECVTVFLGFCMSFALRVKLGGWWKNTVIFRCLCLLWHIVQKLWQLMCSFGRMLKKIPMVWKTALVCAVVCIVDLILEVAGMSDDELMALLWIMKSAVLFPAVVYAALMLRRLYAGSQALAAGNLTQQVDTRHMIWDFKTAAENLNNIGDGMTRAVEARTNSERMKTELITNVSHDLKTPLTSIINYSDLICREPAGSAQIGEYAQVLHRQSERLKRLVDDLVEASKASTGNLEVNLTPCALNVLLSQTAGEYMQRMEQAGLELVVQLPEEELLILADGRRMWRVFDNLMNNACKYAAPGTRVYLTAQKQGDSAVIAFKNTSRRALNISAEELMERFVRGDASRNTEGSGLGLSIARSLTELQYGTLNLSIDGDFFKAELCFPLNRK